MNGYDLTRMWYNYKFKHPDKVKARHSDMFFYLVDLWNRLGQKKQFGLPTTVTMEALGIGSYNTYKKTLDDLFSFGFIKLISESKNQHQSKVIALSKIDKATDEALDKATIKATDEAPDKAPDSIIEQRTIEQRTKNEGNSRALDFLKDNFPSRFETEFLMRFDKKIENIEKFKMDFNDTVDQEDLEYTPKKLFARLGKYARNWVDNQHKYQNNGKPDSEPKIGRQTLSDIDANSRGW